MNRLLYNILLHTVVGPLLVAYYVPAILFGKKYRRSLRGKLGRLSPDFLPERLGRPRIWFHAVSVGEIAALVPLIHAVKTLLPESAVIVSTGTETGQEKARSSIAEADGFLYLPLDFPECVDPVVERIHPDLFVLMETELWPNLIHSLKSRGTSIVLANGRISDRSFPRYKKLRCFFSSVLQQMDLFLMSSELDAFRIKEMGAPAAKIKVTGNTKFDAAPIGGEPDAEHRLREMLDLHDVRHILVAGSTHPGEHEIVLDAYLKLAERFSDLVLILAPRHPDKTPSILSAMELRGMPCPFLRTSIDRGEKRDGRQVVIVDCIGELYRMYSLASVVFIGGSLVPRGGQNILEPASWGKVVLFGPHMEDFRDARDILLHSGAGVEVRDKSDLVENAARILKDPVTAQERGLRGQAAILEHVGSAQRNAEILANYMPHR